MKRRFRRLNKEERKIVYGPPESNAGVGWVSPYGRPAEPEAPEKPFDPREGDYH